MTIKNLFSFILLFGLLAFVILLFFFAAESQLNWKSVWAYRHLFLIGWLNTIYISISSLFLSLLVGLVAALLRRSSLFIAKNFAKIYIELIRGTPLLVQILFFYYVVAHAVGLENRYVGGVLILSFFHGAYIAEMIRGSIESVNESQLESARAIGLSTVQSYRFIIFPQAVRQIIPALAGQFASIIKDSSLLSIIGINEATNAAQQINSATYSTLESFLPLAVAYLILTLPISLWSKSLEKKFKYEA